MPMVSRGIFFIVIACTLVLLSLVMYNKVLSKHSEWLEHSHMGITLARNPVKNKFLNFAGKELWINYARNSGGSSNQRRYNALNITSLSLGNSVKAGREHPVGMKIMVMAQMRTGSTLLGEIFNQNPNLFYLFEPLHATDNLVQMRLLEPNKIKVSMSNLLRKLSKCTFPSEYMFDIYNWRIARGKSRTIRDMCEARLKCSTINPTLFNARCTQRNGNMAMKMIRADLETLRPLVTDDHLNVKILHLVRDPRGTANSRRDFYCSRKKSTPNLCTLDKLGLLENDPQKYKYNTMHKFCTWLRETVRTAIERPDWLRGNYKLIRYEDLALDPLRFAKEIYDFLGLPLHPEVTRWLKANTQANTIQSGKSFNTKKNSTEAAIIWRNSLSFKEAQDVERKCGDMMEVLGYLPIKTKEDLRNYDVPVTVPLNIGSDISFV